MKLYTHQLIFALTFLLLPILSKATVYTAIASSDWHLNSTWDQNSVPGALDTVIIDGFTVTINELTDDVTIKYLLLTNASNFDDTALEIDGNHEVDTIRVTITDGLVAISENFGHDVNLVVIKDAILTIQSDVTFRRTNDNSFNTNLFLNLKDESKMFVDGQFLFDYQNAKSDQVGKEIYLENESILDVTGDMIINLAGGKNFDFLAQADSQVRLRNNFTVTQTGGVDLNIEMTYNCTFLLLGDFLLTKSGGTGSTAFEANGGMDVSGDFTVNQSSGLDFSFTANSQAQINGNFTVTQTVGEDINIIMNNDCKFNLLGNFSLIKGGTGNALFAAGDSLDITGSFTVNHNNGQDFTFIADSDSKINLRGDLTLTQTGGEDLYFTVSSSSIFHLYEDFSLTKSGGTGPALVEVDGANATFHKEINLNTTAADKLVEFRGKGNGFIYAEEDIILSAQSEGDILVNLDGHGTLNLKGNFQRPTNYGSLDMHHDATLIYNGSTPQIIALEKLEFSGTDEFVYTNLQIDNSASVSLADTMRVEENLHLTRGKIVTDDTKILILEDKATLTGMSDSTYIVGPMIKRGKTNNEPFVFGVGNADHYAPVEISEMIYSNSEVKVSYYSDPPPWGNNLQSGIDNILSNGYWEFSKNIGSDTVSINLHFSEDITGNSISNLDDLVVVRLNETSGSEIWENYGNINTTGNTSAGTVAADTTLAYLLSDPPPWGNNKFTLGSISALNVLPVELTKFQAIQQSTQVYMQWETASEQNTSHFEVERSTNGFSFEMIGKRSSAGNTTIAQQYYYNDINPKNGLSYYRLKIIDLDGSFEYSHIEVVKYDSAPSIQLFPNPVKDVIHLKINNLNSEKNLIEIFDRTGKLLFMDAIEFEDGALNLDTDSINIYENGTYFIRISGKTENQILKFIKMK